jgi:hypothetical protein
LNFLHPRIICTKFDFEFGLLVLEKIFKNFHCIFTLPLSSPLGEGISPSFEQTWIPSPKDDLCQFWLKLVQWFWRRSQKCKSLQTDRQMDTGQQAIRKAHLSFQLRWAKEIKRHQYRGFYELLSCT